MRWGSAFGMLDRAYKLRVVSLHIWTSAALRLWYRFKPINLFISSADQLYGHITTSQPTKTQLCIMRFLHSKISKAPGKQNLRIRSSNSIMMQSKIVWQN
jgi:hypothetical protein